MPFVVVRHRPGVPFLLGKPRLRPIQRLDLTLFIKGEVHRSFGRMQVQPHHVGKLRNERGIGRQFERGKAMGFQPMLDTRAKGAPQISKRIPSMPTSIPAASTSARSADCSISIGFVLLMCV
jgi:hypothetical protein